MTDYVLPVHSPELSLIWLRTVDATEHDYGPGSPNALLALRAQDQFLGRILAQLEAQQQLDSTNILIASDHSHLTVSGPLSLFPKREVVEDPGTGKNKVGGVSDSGYSVSGFVRSADLLTRAGFHAYDGAGCNLSLVLGGIRADGSLVYPVQTDTTGALCGTRYLFTPDGQPGTRVCWSREFAVPLRIDEQRGAEWWTRLSVESIGPIPPEKRDWKLDAAGLRELALPEPDED